LEVPLPTSPLVSATVISLEVSNGTWSMLELEGRAIVREAVALLPLHCITPTRILNVINFTVKLFKCYLVPLSILSIPARQTNEIENHL
jgi:hypothetical protein